MKKSNAPGGRREYRKPPTSRDYKPAPTKTYWNGLPAKCRHVRVIVGKSPLPTWWCADLEGQDRKAIEVCCKSGDPEYDKPFYLDNEDGSGWLKVTVGMGSPQWGHRSLPIERVLAD